MSSPALFVLLISGEREKIQMAAMAASVAAVSERPVHVFVSMNALTVFRKGDAATRYGGGEFATLMAEKGAPDPIDLIQQGKALGSIEILACSLALDLASLGIDDLTSEVFDGVGGLTKFLADAEAGQLVVF